MPFPLPRSVPPTAAWLALVLSFAAPAARAQAPAPPPQGVVSLAASATVEVPNDWMTLVLSTTRDGQDAASVQSLISQALDAALAQARRSARPNELEVRTGNFALFPRYDKDGRIAGWRGSAELVLEGRDMPAIASLAARIGTMTVARVAQGLSREARDRVEGEVAAQAIARWRAKAEEIARAFGYGGYTLREVNVAASDHQPPMPLPMLRARAMAAPAADEPLPVEAGKGTVTVSVNGTIQLTK